MDRAEIRNRVVALVAETLELAEGSVADDARFDALGADSFDLLELVTAFEDEFGLTMDDDALGSIATIADAVEAICDAQ